MIDGHIIAQQEQQIRTLKAQIEHLKHMIAVKNKKLLLAGEKPGNLTPWKE